MTSSSRQTAPSDIASLAAFRIAFGVLMFADVLASLARGTVASHWIRPVFHFTYPGFEWLHVPVGYVTFAFLGIAALGIATGFFYRIASAFFFFAITCVFATDAAAYRSCDYLIVLLSGIMAVVPAHRAFSFDARRLNAAETIPAWPVWLLRIQFAVVCLFSGIARLNHAWLSGEPLTYWFESRASLPVIGHLLTKPWVVSLFAYGLPVFDLAIVPLLLWHRTRVPAFLIACGFHLTNGALFGFDIGTWLMIAGTTLFLAPAWPRRIGWIKSPATASETPRTSPIVLVLVAIYALVQIAIPLRHVLYPGDMRWTDEGWRFSWRSKSRSKEASAIFYVTDPKQKTVRCVDPIDELEPWQIHRMASQPDLIVQYARHLADIAQSHGEPRPEVRARALCSLNGRLPRPLVSTNLDLATLSFSWSHSPWIASPTNEPVTGASASEQPLLASRYREARRDLAKLVKLQSESKSPADENNPRTKMLNALRGRVENQKRALLEQLQDAVLSNANIEDVRVSE